MVINISVQYSGGLLPDIILLTQGYYQWGGFVFTTFVMYITTTMCNGVLHCLVFNVFLVILLTRCYLHRGTCLNAMKRFLKKNQNAPRPSEHPPVMVKNVFAAFDPTLTF